MSFSISDIPDWSVSEALGEWNTDFGKTLRCAQLEEMYKRSPDFHASKVGGS